MDEDTLMAMLEDIKQEIANTKNEVGGLWNYVSDITETNNKLDRIIELLEELKD